MDYLIGYLEKYKVDLSLRDFEDLLNIVVSFVSQSFYDKRDLFESEKHEQRYFDCVIGLLRYKRRMNESNMFENEEHLYNSTKIMSNMFLNNIDH